MEHLAELPDPERIRVISTVFETEDKTGRAHRFAVTYEAWDTDEVVQEPDPYADNAARINVRRRDVRVRITQVLLHAIDVTYVLHGGIRHQLADAARKRELQLADVRRAEAA